MPLDWFLIEITVAILAQAGFPFVCPIHENEQLGEHLHQLLVALPFVPSTHKHEQLAVRHHLLLVALLFVPSTHEHEQFGERHHLLLVVLLGCCFFECAHGHVE